MSGQVLALASIAAMAAFLLVRGLMRTPVRLGPRLAPYTERVRGRLGTVLPQPPAGSRSVWVPMITAAANRLGAVLDAGASGDIELRLRRAGLANLGVDGYRKRQLAYTVSGVVLAVALAVLLGLSTAAGLVLAVVGLAAGSLRWRAKLDRLIEDRRATMRAEAHTVGQMLAIWLRTGDTPPGALDRLARRTAGIVPAELTEAAALIRSGSPPIEVLDRLAVETAEPAAARLYRLYGASWSAGGDPAALLALADDLRAGRRDALARTMAKRRVAMAIPLVAVIGPILILFIAAAIPSIVFGR